MTAAALDSPNAYVKAIRDLGAVGALIGICGFLVWRLASGIPSQQDVNDVKVSLSQHVAMSNAELATIRALLRNICYNTSTTENQRAACGASN